MHTLAILVVFNLIELRRALKYISAVIQFSGVIIVADSFFLFSEKPDKIVIQRVGDSADNIIASAGEDLEMECIATGGNPPPTLIWYADDQKIRSGHTQDNSRPGKNVRTWTSISRLMLPVSKADDGATIRCEAEHPALKEPLSARKLLTIHCKSFLFTTRNKKSVPILGGVF